TRFVYLTDITFSPKRNEAFLYDRYNNRKTRLRKEAGFDSFKILDNDGETRLRGRVIKIEPRDVVVSINEKYYDFHIGESLEETLKKPLNAEELKAFGVSSKGKPSSSPD